ncbi:MAG: hypothetical protein ACD_82C00023G0002 [uncultured bacterium]|jgi:hypothetical protein|nr:MAG: hypothetical protein ACD_82C00023G0002 [uncultured bacterium]KKP29120.1 MAG: hypothetical protein UR12_C0015G0010 [candidate division TM6 bacterium GW2011_GWF2_30_66]
MKKKIFTLLFLTAFAGKTYTMNDDNFFISEDTSPDYNGFKNLSSIDDEFSFDSINSNENKNQFSNFYLSNYNNKEEEPYCKMHDEIDISKYTTKLLNPEKINKITNKIINLNIDEEIKTNLITNLLENNEKLNEKYLEFISEFDKNNTLELKTHNIA